MTDVVQSPYELLSEEESQLLGKIWMAVQQSIQSGRLDAAGMEPDEINRTMNGMYRTVAGVVNSVFSDALETLV